MSNVIQQPLLDVITWTQVGTATVVFDDRTGGGLLFRQPEQAGIVCAYPQESERYHYELTNAQGQVIERLPATGSYQRQPGQDFLLISGYTGEYSYINRGKLREFPAIEATSIEWGNKSFTADYYTNAENETVANITSEDFPNGHISIVVDSRSKVDAIASMSGGIFFLKTADGFEIPDGWYNCDEIAIESASPVSTFYLVSVSFTSIGRPQVATYSSTWNYNQVQKEIATYADVAQVFTSYERLANDQR